MVEEAKASQNLNDFLDSNDDGLIRMGISMAESVDLSNESISIIFNLSLSYSRHFKSNKSIGESAEKLILSKGFKRKYEEYVAFVKDFEGTFSPYSLLIDWALNRHANRETAVSLLKKIEGNSFYTDYLISCLKNVYLDFDGEYCREMLGEIWEAGERGISMEDPTTYPYGHNSREKEVFDIITKKAKDGQTYGLDPFDYLADSIYEAFDVYFDTCKIMVEVLKTITTFQSDRSLKLLENLLEEKGGDSPIYGQIENAIVILSGGQGKDWDSFDFNFGVYL
tara:strand:- start:1404 stop:2246 length:843 start_codon:yes stop_codon:yes gene_type:complete